VSINHRAGNSNQNSILSQNISDSNTEWRTVINELVVALAAYYLQLIAWCDSHNNSNGCDRHTLMANVQSSGTRDRPASTAKRNWRRHPALPAARDCVKTPAWFETFTPGNGLLQA
jgi:hypothetical protein